MSIFKKGSNWHLEIRNQGRRIRRCIGPKKKDAEKVLKEMKAINKDVRFNSDGSYDWNFNSYADRYRRYLTLVNLATEDNLDILGALKIIYGELFLSDFTPDSAEACRLVPLGARIKAWSLLKHMFTLAIKCDLAKTNPVDESFPSLDDPYLDRILSSQEFRFEDLQATIAVNQLIRGDGLDIKKKELK